MTTNDPHRFWPEEGSDTDTSTEPAGDGDSSQGGARGARASQSTLDTSDTLPASVVSEPQKEETSHQAKEQSEYKKGAYRAPGMPAGVPQRIPGRVKVGSELPPPGSIRQEETTYTPTRGWEPDEEDAEGVVHINAKGVRQTGSGVFVFAFFAIIVLVVLGVFLFRYLNLTLGIAYHDYSENISGYLDQIM
ncbi:MAG: hypothetical protein H8D63_00655 [Parcubacteria group bacterium]|nr:hypothetical protein [Parcubacteria group bacterium]